MKRGRKKILICDDEPGVRDALRLILETDYKLYYSRNGRDAVERVERFKPDFVMMDIKMPFLNGLEALKQIRRTNPAVPVLVVSGYEASDVAAEAIRAGANDYLTKPFHKDEVARKVRSMLGTQKGRTVR